MRLTRLPPWLGMGIALGFGPLAGEAAVMDKANNTANLNLGSSWVGGVAPGAGDTAQWSSTVTGPNTVALGADTSWLGALVLNPAGAVIISAGNTLTLGTGGVDLSQAATNLTLDCGLQLGGSQTWNVTNGQSLVVNGVIGGQGVTLSLGGAGTAQLNAANTFSGQVAVNAGRLNVANTYALGYAPASVASGAQLYIGAAGVYTNGLTLTGTGTDGQGALRFNGGTAGWAGPITLANSARIGAYAAGGAYRLSGGIGGTGLLLVWAGGSSYTHVHTFTLAAPCSYSGDTEMDTYAACPVLVLAGGANTLPTNTVLTMLAGVWNGQVLSATLQLNGNSQALAGLASGGGVFGSGGSNWVVNGAVGTATLSVNSASNQFFDGYLGGPGANQGNFGFTKGGAGALTINRACAITGALAVNGGLLNLAGGLSGGPASVADGATLLVGSGTNTVTGLTLSPGSALGLNLGAPDNAANTVLNVNGNLVMAGTVLVQDLGNAAAGTTLTVINYTGALTNLGMTTDPRSQWSVQVDTSAPGKVKLVLLSKAPGISFATPDLTVSNSLQAQMQGTLTGFPVTPVYYEVRTPDNRLWDFGAVPPSSSWAIGLRHLRSGTNNVRVFTLGNGGSLQQDTRQVVLLLGTSPPVRPRPWPAEIWWGGVATALSPDYGFAQLLDPARPWTFVQQYQDGIYLHGILPTTETLGALAAAVAPYLGRFGREDGYYTQADLNFGFENAAGFNSDLVSLAGVGLHLSFHSVDYNPGMKVWPNVIDPGWCEHWPNWTHTQLLTNNMNCWSNFVATLHANWPGLKLGMTWSPVWFNWNGYPALVPSGDELILHPVTDAAGNAITNQYGTNAWFDFDMQEFFKAAAATAQAGDGYYGFASDCPYDYFWQWSDVTARTNNQTKILGYEAWQLTNGYFPTTICNYSAETGSDTNSWDAQFTQNSLAY